MKEIFEFLKELKANNDRVWFAANKDRYLSCKKMEDELASALIAAIAEFDPEIGLLTPADCTYRIYRDTRFSPDKTPYKTHMGIFMMQGGKRNPHNKAGYYLHLEPGNCMVAGGIWYPESPQLKKIRQDIYDNVDEFLEIIENPSFKENFPVIGEDLLKTAPKGFPKDWEHIDLLKPRSYTVGHRIPQSIFYDSDKGVKKIAEYFRILQPYNAFLNYSEE